MSNFFGSINEVDSHKTLSHNRLALEKYWVTQCGWLQLYTAVAMGMTSTNFWKILFYGVKKYHFDKLSAIR